MVIKSSYFQQLIDQIKKLPGSPGVYLFKDEQQRVVYIGKAKNLKKRCMQYVQRVGVDIKVDTIFTASTSIDYITAQTELEALLLEAKLIQSHQPKCNVLLKSGQPFVYLFISSSSLPELKVVRNQKQKGSYFGPFLEKGHARKVADFFIKTFRLKLCKKKIEKGCLFYHLNLCAGICRSDFDKNAYLERLALVKNALKQGHKKFLEQLKQQIDVHNAQLEFEKSRELHQYYLAFERIFDSIDHKPTDIEVVTRKDIWILTPDRQALFVFTERAGALKTKRVFYFTLMHEDHIKEAITEYFLSFYRTYKPPAHILVNVDLEDDSNLYATFFKEFHQNDYDISIVNPQEGHFAALIRLGIIHAQQEMQKKGSLSRSLKQLLKLPYEPQTIDCFDISHKQGMFMVGSCVRFKNGQPDKPHFRHFYIKTVDQQDDYASLREIVTRRYQNLQAIPDIILIDGGKGQLNAIIPLLPQAEVISLAKREETVYSKRFPEGKVLDQQQYAAQVLIALRDYAHHFALSFHKKAELAGKYQSNIKS